jgi:hypothetical protein
MLIAIDQSIGQFDRALIGLATNFRGAFRSRAGGFKAPMVSTFAWAIALMIANAAMATATQMGVWRSLRAAAANAACSPSV